MPTTHRAARRRVGRGGEPAFFIGHTDAVRGDRHPSDADRSRAPRRRPDAARALAQIVAELAVAVGLCSGLLRVTDLTLSPLVWDSVFLVAPVALVAVAAGVARHRPGLLVTYSAVAAPVAAGLAVAWIEFDAGASRLTFDILRVVGYAGVAAAVLGTASVLLSRVNADARTSRSPPVSAARRRGLAAIGALGAGAAGVWAVTPRRVSATLTPLGPTGGPLRVGVRVVEAESRSFDPAALVLSVRNVTGTPVTVSSGPPSELVPFGAPLAERDGGRTLRLWSKEYGNSEVDPFAGRVEETPLGLPEIDAPFRIFRTIPPGGGRTARYLVRRRPGRLEPGEYRAVISFRTGSYSNTTDRRQRRYEYALDVRIE